MEFRLIYEGALPSNGSPTDKHRIRKEFHKQLAELWQTHPGLAKISRPYVERFTDLEFEGNRIQETQVHQLFSFFRAMGVTHAQGSESEVEYLAKKFTMCGFNFVPLVNEDFALFCELDILFLRRESPGKLVLRGGDIDNRVKTLFDALHVPKNCSEVPDIPEDSEKPFYCLLEDDSLITSVRVRTDHLLTPLKGDQKETDVILIIRVILKKRGFTLQNLQFIS